MTEEELRERLRMVDDLTPPDADFEVRALSSGQRRLAARRGWARGLLGAAAVVVVGSLTWAGITHPSTTSGTSAAGVAAEKQAGAPSAQDRSPGPGQGGAPGSTAGPRAAQPAPATSLPTIVASIGGPRFDFTRNGVPGALSAVASSLAKPPYDEVYTAMRVVPAPSAQVRVYLTRFDPAAMAVVTQGLPSGTPITFVQSAYSTRACAVTLARVGQDAPALQQQGVPVAGFSCGDLGRVAVALGPTATEGRRDLVKARYGDVVDVAPAEPTTTPPGR
jgi:hypothetical protein